MEVGKTAVLKTKGAGDVTSAKLAVEKTFSEQVVTSSCQWRLVETWRDLQNAEGLESSGYKFAAEKRKIHCWERNGCALLLSYGGGLSNKYNRKLVIIFTFTWIACTSASLPAQAWQVEFVGSLAEDLCINSIGMIYICTLCHFPVLLVATTMQGWFSVFVKRVFKQSWPSNWLHVHPKHHNSLHCCTSLKRKQLVSVITAV